MQPYLKKFNYQIIGENNSPKLVFLHGLMGFGSNWKTFAKHFEAHYQSLLFDQRGHGRSFQPTHGYRLEDYVFDLEQILNELRWSKVILIGHSMGARVAARMSFLHPTRVEKLIMVDMGPQSNVTSMVSIEEKIKMVPVPFSSREEARSFFDGPFLQKYKSETLKQFFYANLESKNGEEMTWRFFLPGILETLWQSRTVSQWEDFESFQMPTLLVRGERSLDFSQELYEDVLTRNPNVQGVVVPGAGHWVHAEKPRELLQIFEDFLKK